MVHPLRQQQIEHMLLCAHIEREKGIDLIEDYFMTQSSLDEITKCAQKLIRKHTDKTLQQTIVRNLSECIVVKMQKKQNLFSRVVRNGLAKLGFSMKRKDVKRAEQLIQKVLPFCDPFPLDNVCVDE
jgi:hypothetical protein